LLPGTPESVSYAGEFQVDQIPPELALAGTVTWMAQGDEPGAGEYRLVFRVAKSGRAIQVPYPPHNLRLFDPAGRTPAPPWFPRMQIRPSQPFAGVLHIYDHDQHVTTYHVGPVRGATATHSFRRPFFYPVHSVQGDALTDFGKPHDPTLSHAHHYSLWIAHADVNGRDFWSERGGVIEHEQIESQQDGPVFCQLVQRTRWVWADEPIVKEIRRFTFYPSVDDSRVVDVALRYSPAGKQAVTFGQTSFGFLAVRVAASMTVFDGAGEIINAQGHRNESGAHRRRAEWLDQSGPVAAGRWAGIAILDHPENPGHPNAWHCRNDGWAGASIHLDGATTIEPGQVLELRYRLYLHAGNAAEGQVARRWKEYKSRPVVQPGRAVQLIDGPQAVGGPH
jgi:hypothetical protein